METKKVLWTALSVVMALAVVSGIALALTYPRGGSAAAPASVAAVAPPRVDSPDAYVRAVEPLPPQPVQPVDTGTDIVIIYGDKPAPSALPGAPASAAQASPPAGAQPAAAAPAATLPAAPAPATTKPYVPAPSAKATSPAPSAASPKPAATTAKPAAKPAASIHEYWIQAAAFSSRSRADDLQRDLAAKGLSTLITMKDIDGVTWYRVRVGPYRSESEAKGWLDRIKAMAGCSEAYVSRQTSRSS